MRKAGFKVRRASPDSGLASPNIGPNYVCRRVAGIDVWYVAAGVGIHTDLFARLREKSSCALQKYFSGKGAKTQRKAAQESRKKTVANSSARG